MESDSNDYCRKCENCGLIINDIFINRCPRCNSILKPMNHSCDSCASKNSCHIKIDFESKIGEMKK